jgi:predicted RNase H-like HicB family nuclease
MECLVIIEKATGGSDSAYVPDRPGCDSCGDLVEETRTLIEEDIRLHLDSRRRHQEPVPEPSARACLVRGLKRGMR